MAVDLNTSVPHSARIYDHLLGGKDNFVAGAAAYRSRGIPAVARTDDEVTALFRGLDLVEPGVTLVSRWRPGPEDAEVEDFQVQMSGGVAIKQ
jgi:hypothetical protein